MKLVKADAECQTEGYQLSHGHSCVKFPSKCTERHMRNLKRKRLDGCNESLSWLEAEGYTATKYKVCKEKTGEMEVLHATQF